MNSILVYKVITKIMIKETNFKHQNDNVSDIFVDTFSQRLHREF